MNLSCYGAIYFAVLKLNKIKAMYVAEDDTESLSINYFFYEKLNMLLKNFGLSEQRFRNTLLL